jgi:hypothetical protein
MNTQSFEDWLIGATAAVAVAVTLGAHVVTMPIAATANAAEYVTPAYTLTITAQRLPAACKSVATKRTVACQAYGAATEVMTVR